MKIILTALGVAAAILAMPAHAAEAAMTAGDLKELSHSPARGTADAAPFLASTLAEAFPCSGSRAAQH